VRRRRGRDRTFLDDVIWRCVFENNGGASVANLEKMLDADGCVAVEATCGRARHVVLEPSGPLLSVQLSQAILGITMYCFLTKKFVK
jgi:hypothetical protein